MLNPSFAERHGWEQDAGTLSVDALGAVRGVERHKVPLLQLGPYDVRGVVAAAPSGGRLPAAFTASVQGRARISGILGAEVLRHFVVTLDLKNTRIHIAPSRKVETESWESSVSSGAPPPQEPTPAEGPAPAL